MAAAGLFAQHCCSICFAVQYEVPGAPHAAGGHRHPTHYQPLGHQAVSVRYTNPPSSTHGDKHMFPYSLQVVTKLFHIVEPDAAYFGRKDYQQWRVIQRMVRAGCGCCEATACMFLVEDIGRSEVARACCSSAVRLGPPSGACHACLTHQPLAAFFLLLQVRDMDMAVQVVGMPILREADGLAMSRCG